ncbi:MAG: hypothetical protein OXN27_00370 [Candidatus Poribacteria bacterium]|nr:hypothetical protein [Candidatus Poribacteria bacterium]MDE0322348.1 hypothetical protein [Candidatus Poribacteria bacterium]
MKSRYVLLAVCAIGFLLTAQFATALDKIEGPWMWMITESPAGGGGAAVTDDDGIKDATKGKLTEEDVAKEGITDKVLKVKFAENYEWTEGEIAAVGGNNINDTLLKIKLGPGGDINDHCSYAVINAVSKVTKKGVEARVGSDDSVKVWMNGDEVHKNAVNRGAGDFQDTFDVDLKKGDNVFMVKVCERGGGWSMFAGIDADLDYNLKFKGLPVEPAGKLATKWSEVKSSY